MHTHMLFNKIHELDFESFDFNFLFHFLSINFQI
jgi:hypothetical protein